MRSGNRQKGEVDRGSALLRRPGEKRERPGTPLERASGPHTHSETRQRGVSIPPHTRPLEPKQELIHAGEEGEESHEHYHSVPQYENGWCVIVWIFYHPLAGAPPLTPRGKLMQLGANPTALMGPSQPQANRVAAEVGKANQIFAACGGGLQFRICDIILLDTRKVTWGPPNKPKRLVDVFTDAGRLNLGTGEGKHDMGLVLGDIMTNGAPNEFVDMMRKPCVHLFFAHDVEDAEDATPEEGVGSMFTFGNQTVSYGIVDAGGTIVGQTIAHEIAHSLDELHSTEPGNLMRESVTVDDTQLTPDQCKRMKQYLENNIAPACP